MIERLQRVPRWSWPLAAGLLGVLVYLVGVDGLLGVVAVVGVVLTAVATIAAAVFQVWNPFEPRPKPQLALKPVDGEESASLHLGLGLRSIDVDAVVENARKQALARRPADVSLPPTQFARPTRADHEQYDKEVEDYAKKLRAWVLEAGDYYHRRNAVLHARVIQSNPSSVDADDAGVHFIFPAGTEKVEDEQPPSEPPTPPQFPLRRAGLGFLIDEQNARMAAGWSGVSVRPPIRALRALGQQMKARSIRDAQYERLADGRLEVSYPRQSIRHGEQEPAGRPFQVRLPAGEHEVEWRVHAHNLREKATGTWTVNFHEDYSRAPITSLAQLEAALGIEYDAAKKAA